MNARIHEIFSSVQGEGPFVGQRHIFVRFSGCDIRCRYCDTPTASTRYDNRRNFPGRMRAQASPQAFTFEDLPDIVTPVQLSRLCERLVWDGPSRPVLSLTGGEPLLHNEFLAEWLPAARDRFRIYLETNGIHYESMEKLRGLIDIVSLDFKLPSATGLPAFWDEHWRFLAAAGNKNVFVKTVVTSDTVTDDIVKAANIIAQIDPFIPLVIQPAGGRFAPETQLLIDFQNRALSIIADVRVIPQVHTMLSLP